MADRSTKLQEYAELVTEIASRISDCAFYARDDEDPLKLAQEYGGFNRLEDICNELKIAMPFRNPDRIIFSFNGKY